MAGGFPHDANADETRQAQHQLTNDTPADVNMNAIVARSQALTFDALGKQFAAAADRRTILADAAMGKQAAGGA